MRRTIAAGAGAGIAWAVLATAANGAEPVSPCAVAATPDGTRLYVAAAPRLLLEVNPSATGTVVRSIALDAAPAAICIGRDGSRVLAAGGVGRGYVWDIDRTRGKVARTFEVGHSPAAMVLSPDGATLYVCDRFPNRVLVLDAATGAQKAVIAVPREPIACALTPDGATLAVVNHLPACAATAETVSIEISLIDTAAGKVAAAVRLPTGCTAGRGICMSPDGRFAYVTSILGRYTLPTTQLDRGWMMTSALSVIDVAGRKLVNTVLLDEVDRGAANPWGVACTADGARLLVAHSGTHEVSVIDRPKLHDRLDRVAAGEKVTAVSSSARQVPNDLAFLVDIRERVRLPGNGPRALAAAGGKVYVGMYFTDALAVLNPSATTRTYPTIALGPATTPSPVRRGEILFHDAVLCFQAWQSCTSCHPDSRADGLNWDLLNDGMGNPKQTKNMTMAHKTPPSMMTGIRDSAEVAVRSGIRHIQFAVRPEEDARAIDEYLKSLTPAPSPHRVRGRLSDSARRGGKVFRKAGCAACHPPPLYTSLEAFDVGTGTDMDKDKAYDTPALVEVWRTAPYLVDGRAATIREVLTLFNAADRHGVTSGLSEKDLEDLESFVLSL